MRESLIAERAKDFDPIDCFNADLVWIIDKLVSRTSGQFGFLCRYLGADDGVEILARSSDIEAGDALLLPQIAAHARHAVDSSHLRVNDNEPAIGHSDFRAPVEDGEARRFRLTHLAFSPTDNVRLIATIGKVARTLAIHTLDDMTATRLYPVLSRYIRLWWLHRLERRRANSLAIALDLSDVGVLLLNRRGEVLFANTPANVLVERGDGLKVQGTLVTACDAQANVKLQAAIQSALYCNSIALPEDATRQRSPIVTMQRSSGRRPLIATVMHVGRPIVDGRDAAVILYIVDPEQSVEHLLAPACAMYKLTPVETRLTHHLVRGMMINEAAESMRIQPDTARSYLKQIFTKTSTHRQAELMRVMLTSMTRTNARIDPTLL